MKIPTSLLLCTLLPTLALCQFPPPLINADGTPTSLLQGLLLPGQALTNLINPQAATPPVNTTAPPAANTTVIIIPPDNSTVTVQGNTTTVGPPQANATNATDAPGANIPPPSPQDQASNLVGNLASSAAAIALDDLRIKSTLAAPFFALGSQIAAPLAGFNANLAAPLVAASASFNAPLASTLGNLAAPTAKLQQIVTEPFHMATTQIGAGISDAISPITQATQPLTNAMLPLTNAANAGFTNQDFQNQVDRVHLRSDVDKLVHDVSNFRDGVRDGVNQGIANVQNMVHARNRRDYNDEYYESYHHDHEHILPEVHVESYHPVREYEF